MRILIIRILFGLAIFSLLTAPHLIHMITFLKHGFAYPMWLMVVLAVIAPIISKFVVDFLEQFYS